MMFFKEKKIHCLQQKFEHASFPRHANSDFFCLSASIFLLAEVVDSNCIYNSSFCTVKTSFFPKVVKDKSRKKKLCNRKFC